MPASGQRNPAADAPGRPGEGTTPTGPVDDGIPARVGTDATAAGPGSAAAGPGSAGAADGDPLDRRRTSTPGTAVSVADTAGSRPTDNPAAVAGRATGGAGATSSTTTRAAPARLHGIHTPGTLPSRATSRGYGNVATVDSRRPVDAPQARDGSATGAAPMLAA
ncbi:hypothetical protein GCM10010169_13090 [Micromonospora fulviviridis]|nr:hypothetical protein GCM10010169_13090 [Micromonospora fulviviridis]